MLHDGGRPCSQEPLDTAPELPRDVEELQRGDAPLPLLDAHQGRAVDAQRLGQLRLVQTLRHPRLEDAPSHVGMLHVCGFDTSGPRMKPLPDASVAPSRSPVRLAQLFRPTEQRGLRTGAGRGGPAQLVRRGTRRGPAPCAPGRRRAHRLAVRGRGRPSGREDPLSGPSRVDPRLSTVPTGVQLAVTGDKREAEAFSQSQICRATAGALGAQGPYAVSSGRRP